MSDETPPWFFVSERGCNRSVGIPDRFFDEVRKGLWSITAVGLYFHVLTNTTGFTLDSLRYMHPRLDEAEARHSLDALVTAGHIEAAETPWGPGYEPTTVEFSDDDEEVA